MYCTFQMLTARWGNLHSVCFHLGWRCSLCKLQECKLDCSGGAVVTADGSRDQVRPTNYHGRRRVCILEGQFLAPPRNTVCPLFPSNTRTASQFHSQFHLFCFAFYIHIMHKCLWVFYTVPGNARTNPHVSLATSRLHNVTSIWWKLWILRDA